MGSKLTSVSVAILLFALACSKKDDGIQSIIPPVVTILSENADEILLVDVLTVSDQVGVEDISNQFTNAAGFKYFDSAEGLINFVYFEFPNVLIWQKNLLTREEVEETVYTIQADEFVLDAVTSTTHTYLLIDRFINDDEVERLVNIFDIESAMNFTVNLGEIRTFTTGSTYLKESNGYLFVYSSVEVGITDIFKIDIATGEIEKSINIEATPVVIFSDESFYMFFPEGTYSVRSQLSMEETGSGEFQFGLVAAPGGFSRTFIADDRLLIDFRFAQPSSIASAPMQVSLSQNAIITENLNYIFELRTAFEQALGSGVTINLYAFDSTSGLLVIGYTKLANASANEEGGLIYSNLEGDILGYTELDLIPSAIILRP